MLVMMAVIWIVVVLGAFALVPLVIESEVRTTQIEEPKLSVQQVDQIVAELEDQLRHERRLATRFVADPSIGVLGSEWPRVELGS